jgi:hypothetical protein
MNKFLKTITNPIMILVMILIVGISDTLLLYFNWFSNHYTSVMTLSTSLMLLLAIPAIIGCIYALNYLDTNYLSLKERIFISIAILSVIPLFTWAFMLGSTSTEPVLQKWEPVKNNWSLEFRDADIKDIFVELGMEIHSSEYGLDSNKEIDKDTIKQFREADSVNFTLTNNNKKTEVTLDKENLHINGDLENATTLTVSEIKVQRYDKVNKKLNGKIVDTSNESGGNLSLVIECK